MRGQGEFDARAAKNPAEIAIDGDWLARWDELVDPEEMRAWASQAGAKPRFRLPGVWNQQGRPKGGRHGPYGAASFFSWVDLPPGGVDGASIRYLASAYRLYVDGVLVMVNGQPALTRGQYLPQWLPRIAPMPRAYGRVGITLQVANFDNNVGGPFKSLFLGSYARMRHKETMVLALHMILLGSCAMMGLYHLAVFAFNPGSRQYLALAFLCLLNCLKIICTEKYLEMALPQARLFTLVMRLGYLTYYLGIPGLGFYLATCLPLHFPRRLAYAIYGVGLAFGLLVCLGPMPLFQASYYPFSAFTALCFACYAIVLVRAIIEREGQAVWAMAGFLILLSSAVFDISHETLQFSAVYRAIYVMPFGFAAFLFLLTIQHSLSHMRLSRENQALAERLARQRQGLKELVRRKSGRLMEANRRLRHIDEEKTKLFANVSHDLKAPLANLQLSLDSIRIGRFGQDLASADPIFSAMDRQIRSLSHQVASMLNFAGIELKRARPRLRPFDLGEELSFLVSGMMSFAALKRIKLSYKQEEGQSFLAMIDRPLIESAINNLIDNAMKFTPAEGRIEVELSRKGEQSCITVSDTGPGIAESIRERVFERFVSFGSAEGFQNAQGTGIGLALVRGIAEAHGGWAEAENLAGSGARFSIFLPLAHSSGQGQVDVLPESQAQGEAGMGGESGDRAGLSAQEANPQADQGLPHVLIVDDSQDLLRSLARCLSQTFRLSLAGNGMEALKILEAEASVELVVSDMVMPLLDGPALFEASRRLRGRAPLPFIFLSARQRRDEKADMLRRGAAAYLVKPFSIEILEGTIKGVLDLVGREREFLKDNFLAYLNAWRPQSEADNVLGARPNKDEENPPRQATILDGEVALGSGPGHGTSLPAEREGGGIDGGQARHGAQADRPNRSIAEAAAEYGLTGRQSEILEYLVRGYTDAEIASLCNISTKTASDHVRNILAKAKVENRTQLAYELLTRD